MTSSGGGSDEEAADGARARERGSSGSEAASSAPAPRKKGRKKAPASEAQSPPRKKGKGKRNKKEEAASEASPPKKKGKKVAANKGAADTPKKKGKKAVARSDEESPPKKKGKKVSKGKTKAPRDQSSSPSARSDGSEEESPPRSAKRTGKKATRKKQQRGRSPSARRTKKMKRAASSPSEASSPAPSSSASRRPRKKKRKTDKDKKAKKRKKRKPDSRSGSPKRRRGGKDRAKAAAKAQAAAGHAAWAAMFAQQGMMPGMGMTGAPYMGPHASIFTPQGHPGMHLTISMPGVQMPHMQMPMAPQQFGGRQGNMQAWGAMPVAPGGTQQPPQIALMARAAGAGGGGSSSSSSNTSSSSSDSEDGEKAFAQGAATAVGATATAAPAAAVEKTTPGKSATPKVSAATSEGEWENALRAAALAADAAAESKVPGAAPEADAPAADGEAAAESGSSSSSSSSSGSDTEAPEVGAESSAARGVAPSERLTVEVFTTLAMPDVAEMAATAPSAQAHAEVAAPERRRRKFEFAPPPGAVDTTVFPRATPSASSTLPADSLLLGGPGATAEEVEAFLAMNIVDPDAGQQLRQMPPELQRRVLDRGDLSHARNPSAVLIARMRDSKQGVLANDGLGMPAPPPVGDCHAGIEQMIARYSLDARAAQMLRGLAKHKQGAAAQIDMSEARRPSAFIMSKLASPQFADLTASIALQQPVGIFGPSV